MRLLIAAFGLYFYFWISSNADSSKSISSSHIVAQSIVNLDSRECFSAMTAEAVALAGSSFRLPLSPSLDEKIKSIRKGAIDRARICIRVTDIETRTERNADNEVSYKLSTRLYESQDEAKAAIIQQPSESRVRIISIYSKRTIAPLQVTSSLLTDIFTRCHIDASFTNIISAFGDEPHVAEGSSNNFAFSSSGGSGVDDERKMSYELRYVEENKREGELPWSIRHVGVYHANRNDSDLFILLHPLPKPTVEEKLLQLDGSDGSQAELRALCEAPHLMHQMFLSSYSPNWTPYLRYLGDKFSDENNIVMTSDVKEADASSTFQQVRKLRNMADVVLSVRAMCSGNLDIIEGLGKHCPARDTDLKSEASKMRGLIGSADAFQGRIRNAIDFAGYTLTLHNQIEATNISIQLRGLTESLKNLTQDTVDDSTTVKVIALISTFYLPGSFVGTLFGMNFFRFDVHSRNIAVADDFWVFVLTWIPLTFVTGAILLLVIVLDGRSKGKSIRWPWTTGKSTRKA